MSKVVANKNRQENVFDPPYSLKDGDILCVFEPPPPPPSSTTTPGIIATPATTVEDSSTITSVTSPPAAVVLPIISRPEDLYMQPQIEAIQAALKAVESTAGRKPAKDRRVRLSTTIHHMDLILS